MSAAPGPARGERRLPPPPPLPIDRLHMFVPAIMSVGLVFWLATLTRDLLAWRSDRARARRSRIAGLAVAAEVADPGHTPLGRRAGLRLRRSYLVTGLVLAALSVYVMVGAAANYSRRNGYVGDIAWMLALSSLVALVLGLLAAVALGTYASWPAAPRWGAGILRVTPLTRDPLTLDSAREPSWGLAAAASLLPLVALGLSGLVGSSRSLLRRIDEPVEDWVTGQQWLGAVDVWGPMASRWAIIVVLALVGLASLRCRVFAGTSLLVVGSATLATVVLRDLVARPGPSGPGTSSYPSATVVAAVVVAGLVPPAVGLLARRPTVVAPLRGLLVVAGAVVALSEMHAGEAWLSDVVASVALGATLVVGAEWGLAHGSWHQRCRGCLWWPLDPPPHLFAPIPIHVSRHRALRLVAHLSTVVAVVGLAVLTVRFDVPSNPEGSLVGSHVQRPLQLGLAALVSIGALLAWRWEAAGAVVIAVAAVGLGVFAGLEYRPEVALLLTGALLVPAVLLWLSWQHRRSTRSIVALALTTALLLGVTWVGTSEVFGHYFGPAHPQSTTPEVPVDQVRWSWMGALQPDSVTVAVGVDAPGRVVAVRVRSSSGAAVRSRDVPADADAIAQVRLDRLEPGTAYDLEVLVDGVADEGRGRGSFRTPEVGPSSFRIAVASCARTGSDGAVYDEIRRLDPLMYLVLGDIHYANPDADDPALFRSALERVLTSPSQSALYRQVPIGYVWDDHDYGANDADSSSPTRSAALSTYRQMVPNQAAEDPEAPIAQAFTLGRVRFVMTDNRSARTATSMLGDEQERWLIDEIASASRTHAVVVWANPSPWIGEADPASDTWAGFADDRTRIADALRAAAVDNLVMLSGDAHMVAFDDGTNTDYATGGGAGFPLLHAAALDRPGGVKGGPYSGGTFPGGGQFGTLDVRDDGDEVTVELAGWTWEGERLVSARLTYEAPSDPPT